jgi:hypothetical protein
LTEREEEMALKWGEDGEPQAKEHSTPTRG